MTHFEHIYPFHPTPPITTFSILSFLLMQFWDLFFFHQVQFVLLASLEVWPVRAYGQPTKGHVIKESWFSLSQQSSNASSVLASAGILCLLSPSVLWFFLSDWSLHNSCAWGCNHSKFMCTTACLYPEYSTLDVIHHLWIFPSPLPRRSLSFVGISVMQDVPFKAESISSPVYTLHINCQQLQRRCFSKI